MVASLGSTCCVLQTCQRSHLKETEIVCIFTTAAHNCIGELSRNNNSSDNNRNHPGFGCNSTPASLHLQNLEVAVQIFFNFNFFICIVSFKQKKTALLDLCRYIYIFYIFFASLNSKITTITHFSMLL